MWRHGGVLMAGLMLADKTAGLEDRLRAAEDKLGEMSDELRELRERPATRRARRLRLDRPGGEEAQRAALDGASPQEPVQRRVPRVLADELRAEEPPPPDLGLARGLERVCPRRVLLRL